MVPDLAEVRPANLSREISTMTTAIEALTELAEKRVDVDTLRSKVQFMARRLMKLAVESLRGAGCDEKNPERAPEGGLLRRCRRWGGAVQRYPAGADSWPAPQGLRVAAAVTDTARLSDSPLRAGDGPRGSPPSRGAQSRITPRSQWPQMG